MKRTLSQKNIPLYLSYILTGCTTNSKQLKAEIYKLVF